MPREYAIISLPTGISMAGLAQRDNAAGTERLIASDLSGFSVGVLAAVSELTISAAKAAMTNAAWETNAIAGPGGAV